MMHTFIILFKKLFCVFEKDNLFDRIIRENSKLIKKQLKNRKEKRHNYE